MKQQTIANYLRILAGLGLLVLMVSCSASDDQASKQKSDQAAANSGAAKSDPQTASTGSYATLGKAPGFEIQDLTGKTVNWNQYQGKLVLVDFWATWCGPCRRSIPHLAELHKKYLDKGFEVVGISLDKSDKSEVADFAKQMGIPYTVLMGSMELASDWGVGAGIPVAFLVDRKGDIVDKFIGYHESGEYEQEIQKFL